MTDFIKCLEVHNRIKLKKEKNTADILFITGFLEKLVECKLSVKQD